jgi:hypothetical protein
LIVDYKHQDYKHPKHRNSQRSGKKPPLEEKILTEEMASYFHCYQRPESIGFVHLARGWEVEGLEEEAKVCFIPLILCFSSSTLPSSIVPGPL